MTEENKNRIKMHVYNGAQTKWLIVWATISIILQINNVINRVIISEWSMAFLEVSIAIFLAIFLIWQINSYRRRKKLYEHLMFIAAKNGWDLSFVKEIKKEKKK